MRVGSRRRLAGVAALALAAGAAPALAGAAAADAEPSAAALAARNSSLRREIELAGDDAFYLVLDPAASTLSLLFKGAPLRETALVSAELGHPRARSGAGASGPLPLDSIFTGGTLVPPRVDVREVVVPPPVEGEEDGEPDGSSGAAQGEFLEGGGEEGEERAGGAAEAAVPEVEIPKTPEELYPVPPSYEIRFSEGLTIEVSRAPERSEAESEGKADAPRRAGDRAPRRDQEAAAPAPEEPGLLDRLLRWARRVSLSRPDGERARLRLVLASRDADLLFRSLPPDVKLSIRAGGGTPQRAE